MIEGTASYLLTHREPAMLHFLDEFTDLFHDRWFAANQSQLSPQRCCEIIEEKTGLKVVVDERGQARALEMTESQHMLFLMRYSQPHKTGGGWRNFYLTV